MSGRPRKRSRGNSRTPKKKQLAERAVSANGPTTLSMRAIMAETLSVLTWIRRHPQHTRASKRPVALQLQAHRSARAP